MKKTAEADLNSFSKRYLSALRKHMNETAQTDHAANRLGRKALLMGLETLDLARAHEEALIALVPLSSPARTRDKRLRRAEGFFMETLVPVEKTHAAATEIKRELNHTSQTLDERTSELVDVKGTLEHEIAQRKAMEEALKTSKQHYSLLLEQSQEMQERLKRLSHQVLFTQEEERKRISRELHDEIAQALTGIHVHLAALKAEATVNTRDLRKRIGATERLVEKSVERVHRFALELRPSLLDDLGVIPALRSFIKDFKERTGIRVHFTARGAVAAEQLGSLERTVLYRVAQEALTNVDKHAEASLVEVNIRKVRGDIRMDISDNGSSFDAERVFSRKRKGRLGLIGMQERVEMVGGSFAIESTPGEGTKITTQIPLGDDAKI